MTTGSSKSPHTVTVTATRPAILTLRHVLYLSIRSLQPPDLLSDFSRSLNVEVVPAVECSCDVFSGVNEVTNSPVPLALSGQDKDSLTTPSTSGMDLLVANSMLWSTTVFKTVSLA